MKGNNGANGVVLGSRGDGDGDRGRVEDGTAMSVLRGEAGVWTESRLVADGVMIPEAAPTHV